MTCFPLLYLCLLFNFTSIVDGFYHFLVQRQKLKFQLYLSKRNDANDDLSKDLNRDLDKNSDPALDSKTKTIIESKESSTTEKNNNYLWLDEEVVTNKFPIFKRIKISLPNIFVGSIFGIIISFFVLFYPDFISSNNNNISLNKSEKNNITPQVTLFEDILTNLDVGYVDKIDTNLLFETGINAMLKSLDPYTQYENVQVARNMEENVNGKYGGVGLIISQVKKTSTNYFLENKKNEIKKNKPLESKMTRLSKTSSNNNLEVFENDINSDFEDFNENNENDIMIVDVFEDYAYDAGLRVGDRLKKIDNIDIKKLSIDQVKDLLRGKAGSVVDITYERNGILQEISIMRQNIKTSDIKLVSFLGNPQNKIGYISMNGFNSNSAYDFKNALLTLRYNAATNPENFIKSIVKESDKNEIFIEKIENDDLKGLIFDLRGNPGGLLDQAVEISSYLLPENSDIVSAKSRFGEEVTYKSNEKPLLPLNVPLIILVDGGSASASEIVSGAVQDLDRGVILGSSRTFGKGLVQKIISLPYKSALKYTIARYYTPSGRCIQAIDYKGGRSYENNFSKNLKNENGILEIKKANDRNYFQTVNGRSVRDGGGIEPDKLLPSIQFSPIESIFISKGIYSDFADIYLNQHKDVYEKIQNAALEIQNIKKYDNRMIQGKSYFVLDRYGGLKNDKNDFENNFSKFYKNEDNILKNDVGNEILEKQIDLSRSQVYKEFIIYLKKNPQLLTSAIDDTFKAYLNPLINVLENDGLNNLAPIIKKDFLNKLYSELEIDLEKSQSAIKFDLTQAIFSRSMPDRILLQRNIDSDQQVTEAIDVIQNPNMMKNLLENK